MPPPIRWKWGLRGCDSGQSIVKVSLPTGLLSLTVGADFDQSIEKYSPSYACVGGDKHRHLLVDKIVLVPKLYLSGTLSLRQHWQQRGQLIQHLTQQVERQLVRRQQRLRQRWQQR